jgi:hypothetical protein
VAERLRAEQRQGRVLVRAPLARQTLDRQEQVPQASAVCHLALRTPAGLTIPATIPVAPATLPNHPMRRVCERRVRMQQERRTVLDRLQVTLRLRAVRPPLGRPAIEQAERAAGRLTARSPPVVQIAPAMQKYAPRTRRSIRRSRASAKDVDRAGCGCCRERNGPPKRAVLLLSEFRRRRVASPCGSPQLRKACWEDRKISSLIFATRRFVPGLQRCHHDGLPVQGILCSSVR